MAHPKSVEERIEESEYVLEGLLDRWALRGQDDAVDPLLAIACELRALRLMLREEIREAAWRIAVGDARSEFNTDPLLDPLASRKAPEVNRWDGFSYKELRVMQMCFVSKEKTRLHPEVTEAIASRERRYA
jgi:hypothetical protein